MNNVMAKFRHAASGGPTGLRLRFVGHALARRLILIGLFVSLSSYAADLEALVTDAVRYANTPEKHAAKVAALEELKNTMPDALREGMDYVHGDNVMLNVLVFEWVRTLPDDTVVPVLLDYVDHERRDTRRLAIFFLGFKDVPEHAERIMPFLDDERCRGSVIRTLGKWKITSSRKDIEKWLAGGNERIRLVAANALRDIGDHDAIPALIEALDDEVFTVRNTSARALISFGDASVEALREEGGRIHQRVLADLGANPVDQVLTEGTVIEDKFYLP